MNKSKSDIKIDDEIDLLQLFRRIGQAISSGFINIGRGILITIVFLLKNWIPLMISVIVGAGTSFIFKYSSPPSYSSEMVLKSNAISSSEMIKYINRLHTFCYENNMAALSEALSLPAESINTIQDIQAYWIIDINKDYIPDYVDYKNNYNIYDTNSNGWVSDWF